MKQLSCLIMFLLLIGITGCGKVEPVMEVSDIGFLISSLNNPFFVEMNDGAVKEAGRRNLSVNILNAENSIEEERSHMLDLIDQGVKVILMNPVDSSASKESLLLALDAGIPVITIDRDIEGDGADVYIASDNRTGGKIAAEHLIGLMKNEGDVLIIEGIAGTSANTQRLMGFKDALDQSQLIIVDQKVADFDREQAKIVVELALKQFPELKGILCSNDEMALGALDSVLEAEAQVLIMGFDGTEDAVKAVVNGYMAGTVRQNPTLMSEFAIATAEDLIEGRPVVKEIFVELELVAIGK